MAWEVDVTWIEEWLTQLDESNFRHVWVAIELLSAVGPTLGRPLVDTIAGSRISNLKELRVTSNERGAIRILFVFDPTRRAILLLGGDKKGAWSAWYRRAIPIAEARYAEHIQHLTQESR